MPTDGGGNHGVSSVIGREGDWGLGSRCDSKLRRYVKKKKKKKRNKDGAAQRERSWATRSSEGKKTRPESCAAEKPVGECGGNEGKNGKKVKIRKKEKGRGEVTTKEGQQS